MTRRTNDVWLKMLQQSGETRQEALEELRDYLHRAVFVYLRDKREDTRHLGFGELDMHAQDYAQIAVTQIQDKLHTFQGRSKFTTWAYRFVINAAAAELRKRDYAHSSLDALLEAGTAVLNQTASHDSVSPDLVAEREDMLKWIVQIMAAELSDKQRFALINVHVNGRSIQETAVYLHTSPNTVYKIIHDARKKLKAGLEKQGLTLGDILAPFTNE